MSELIDIFWQELTNGLPDLKQLAHVIIRLIAAMVLGAFVGIQRERAGKPAGMRTHALVAGGTAVFILAGAGANLSSDGVSRVVQGIATGIGFIGAGSILKLNDEHDIKGLTTAAGIWMTAAIGVAAGVGSLGLALLSALITIIILALAGLRERRMDKGTIVKSGNDHRA